MTTGMVQCQRCKQVKPIMPGLPFGADAVPVPHIKPPRFSSATTMTPAEPCLGEFTIEVLNAVRAERDAQLEDPELWRVVFEEEAADVAHPAIPDPGEWTGRCRPESKIL